MVTTMPTLFKLLSARADFLQARHAVLAQNVANADTPRFKPKDLVEPKFEDMLRSNSPSITPVAVRRTQEDHLAGQPTKSPGPRGNRHDGFEMAPAGNEVIIEEQVRLMGGASRGYQLATSIYGKYVGLMRTAIGSGG